MTHPHEFQGIVTKLRTTRGSPFALDVMRDAANVIDAVLELHQPKPWHEPSDDTKGVFCTTCHEESYPCPTVAALCGEVETNDCSCAACEPIHYGYRLCSLCGNKRCPHAANHLLECTRSNEPGQPGSLYAGVWS